MIQAQAHCDPGFLRFKGPERVLTFNKKYVIVLYIATVGGSFVNYIDPLNPPAQAVKVPVLNGTDRHRQYGEDINRNPGYHWGTDAICVTVWLAAVAACYYAPKWYPVVSAWFR